MNPDMVSNSRCSSENWNDVYNPLEDSVLKEKLGHSRVIIHLDIDCFYAQVEMLKCPAYKLKPLGVQQKNFVITCNYEARARGVKKCMTVKAALEQCPDLVLVLGEDLTDYREMSYKLTSLLQNHGCPVERLGFDENFIDVTELVKNFNECDSKEVNGYVFQDVVGTCSCKCYERLKKGSVIAQQLREEILNKLGLTVCAGISHNKLLAKLVGSTHKPNQQTTLFPEGVMLLLKSLSSVQSLTGIGHASAKKLALPPLNIESVGDLQNTPLQELQKFMERKNAMLYKRWSFGIDDSPVVSSGKPQSHSLEDATKIRNSVSDVKEKIERMVSKLLKRIFEDGRNPEAVKLTIRKEGSYTRQTKQATIPKDLTNCFSPEKSEFLTSKLTTLLMDCLKTLVNVSQSFTLTLVGVCFCRLKQDNPRNATIESYASTSQNLPSSFSLGTKGSSTAKKRPSDISLYFAKKHKGDEEDRTSKLQTCEYSDPDDTYVLKQEEIKRSSFPHNVDWEVFNSLPVELQEELKEEWNKKDTSSQEVESSFNNTNGQLDPSVLKELPQSIRKSVELNWKLIQEQKEKKMKTNSILHYFGKK